MWRQLLSGGFWVCLSGGGGSVFVGLSDLEIVICGLLISDLCASML